MEIKLTLSQDLFVPKLFPLLEDYSHRWEVYFGSAGSSKSYFCVQKIIYRCLKQSIRVLVCRDTANSLRQSTFNLFGEIIKTWKIDKYIKIRDTDMLITFPNGSQIIFVGLDDEGKLLSLNNISMVFVEEATEVDRGIVEQLSLRMRGKVAQQQILMAFNPVSKDHWLYNFCIENPPSSFILTHINYTENPFLSDEYRQAIEDIKERDPQRWRVYGLGEWGIDSEGLVFKNWREEEFDVMALAKQGLEQRNGMDFGWIDPSTCARCFYDSANRKIYVFDEMYETGLQLDEISQKLTALGLTRRDKIYCDSAEPRSISYLKQQGFYAMPCIKGKDSVKARILFLQNNEIIVHPRCVNMIKELSNFSYIKKNDKWTEEMTHEYSHLIDALGYAHSDIYTKNSIKTLDKRILGL